MKSHLALLAAVALLSPAAVLACPDLAGSYVCEQPDGTTQDLALKQEVVDGVTVYTDDENLAIKADGKTYEYVPEGFTKGTIAGRCEGDALIVTMTSELIDAGKQVASMNLETNLKLDANKDITNASKGAIKSAEGEMPIDFTTTCKRK